jgi:thymidylate kinase
MPVRAGRRYPWSRARRPGVHDARRRMRSEVTAKPSSTRGTTVAVPDVGPPLQLVRALCDALEEQAVAYCHFKSNNEIARSAAGLNDLDLLVAASEASRFEELVSRLGFRRARPRPSLRVPGVEHWYGLDSGTGRLAHLHVHLRLVVGDDMTKNYRLPIERSYLASTTHDGLFRIPSPEFELVLFVVRMVLKHGPWDVGIGSRSALSDRERDELGSLLGRIDPGDLRNVLATSVPMMNEALWEACIRVLKADASPASRIRTAYELQRCLAPFARRPQLVDSALKLWRRRARRLRKRLVGEPGKVLDRGGIIAIVGGDGAGKTSAVDDLHRWLRPFRTRRVHMGKPARSATTIAVRGALRAYRLTGLGRGTRGGAPTISTGGGGFPGYVWLLPQVLLARDRYRLSRSARRFADRPGIVISDRFPLPWVEKMDGSRASRFLAAPQVSPLARWLAQRERLYYDSILPPDLLIVLRVRPEVAVDRKRDEEPSDVRDRNAEIWQADWEGSQAHVLDASRPKDLVLSELKRTIWSSL